MTDQTRDDTARPVEETTAPVPPSIYAPIKISGPIPVVVTRYACPHCHRSHGKKPAAVAHIGRCWLNPEVRSCKTCTHHQAPRDSRSQCQPGRDCDCDRVDEECLAEDGPDLAPGALPRTGCLLWAPVAGSAV